ncbi:MAG: kinetochore protein SPC24, partial [Patescibacteria group bacterium]|nr:kinetochore protein SPC24 [Patescibacteria group bacterium]
MSTKRIFITVVTLFLLPLSAGATTISDLESKIAALLSQIQILQSELQTLKSEEPPTPQASVVSSFTTTLGKGSEG